MRERKPNNYWKDFENVREVLLDLESKLGHFPTQGEIRENGYTGLVTMMARYYGGMNVVRERMGKNILRKSHGYWQNVDNVVSEAETIMEEHGFETLPGGWTLSKLGYSSLSTAISSYHGGFVSFRELLGQEHPHRLSGYWTNLGNVTAEAMTIMEEHGFETLPGANILRELGHSSFVYAVDKYYGGMRAFRKILGQEQIERPKGYWKDFGNVMAEVERVMEKLGVCELPGSSKLTEEGYFTLVNAIKRHHGGMRSFRKLLGQEQKRKQDGFWRDADFVIEQAEQIMAEMGVDELPGNNKLNNRGYSSFTNAVNRHYGGLPAFRELLRQHQGLPTEEQRLESLLEVYVGGGE